MSWNRISEGVTFYTASFTHFHTYTDWGLILESDNVSFPQVSGVIDRWEEMYGRSFVDFRKEYGRRKLIFDLGKSKVDSRWPALVSTITGTIHGKKCRVVRDCESTVYYIGRCNVTSYVTHLGIGKVRIEVDAEPFKTALSNVTASLDSTALKTSYVPFTGQTDFNSIISTLSFTFDSDPGDISILVSNNFGSQIDISDVDAGIVEIDGINKEISRRPSGGGTQISLMSKCTKLTRFPLVVPGSNSIRIYPNNLPITRAYVTYAPKFI